MTSTEEDERRASEIAREPCKCYSVMANFGQGPERVALCVRCLLLCGMELAELCSVYVLTTETRAAYAARQADAELMARTQRHRHW